ncbi:hypothetical protein [Streptomyces sp. NPDC058678]
MDAPAIPRRLLETVTATTARPVLGIAPTRVWMAGRAKPSASRTRRALW